MQPRRIAASQAPEPSSRLTARIACRRSGAASHHPPDHDVPRPSGGGLSRRDDAGLVLRTCRPRLEPPARGSTNDRRSAGKPHGLRCRRTPPRATPASAATSARRRTSPSTSRLAPRPHASATASALSDVSTVTARTRQPPPASRAASAAARSIAAPPDAWTVTRDAPSFAALRTPPATVFGMSWNLRSRNTSRPCSRIAATTEGPAAVKSSLPTL